MGESMLIKYLEELLITFNKYILNFLGKETFKLKTKSDDDLDNILRPSKSIKQVLGIQKQYISLLNAYSQIISNITTLNEIFLSHFYKVILIGFSSHYKFYEKYKIKFATAIAMILGSMLNHEEYCFSFLRKIIKNGFLESIKLTENMIFNEPSESFISIENAVIYWILILTRENIYSADTLKILFNQLISEIYELLQSLDIKYKTVFKSINSDDMHQTNQTQNINDNNIILKEKLNELELNNKTDIKFIQYEAVSLSDLEIFNRTCLFIKYFCIEFNKLESINSNCNNLFNEWSIILIKELIDLGTYYPRVSHIYIAITYLLNNLKINKIFDNACHVYSSNKYNNNNNNLKQNSCVNGCNIFDIINFIDNFKIFSNFVIKKLELYQDDLLLNCLELILETPSEIIPIIYKDNISTLSNIYKKALEHGYSDYKYADMALNSLKKFLITNKTSNINEAINDNNLCDIKSISKALLDYILPLFGKYLVEFQKIKENIKISSNNKELILNYTHIQDKIFDILGELGGDAHNIIESNIVSNELSYNSNLNSNFIGLSIINPKSIDYNLPLYNKKYNINLDHIVLKISNIALYSIEKDRRITACELLHSIIIYIIGLETKKSVETTEISICLFEKVLILACDLEKSISKIFESLLFQIVHLLAKKGSIYNSSNNDINSNNIVIKFIDILIDNSTERQNVQLRELSSQCLEEYIKWYIKQHSDLFIKENNFTIKYLIRKCESLLTHKNIFKRLGACLCLEKVLNSFKYHEFLIDKYILEIISFIITVTKLSSSINIVYLKSNEINYEDILEKGKDSYISEYIFKSILKSIDIIVNYIKLHLKLLIKENPKRNKFKNILDCILYLSDKILSVEDECRFISIHIFVKLFDIVKYDLKIESYGCFFKTYKGSWPEIKIGSSYNKSWKNLNRTYYSIILLFYNYQIVNSLDMIDNSIHYLDIEHDLNLTLDFLKEYYSNKSNYLSKKYTFTKCTFISNKYTKNNLINNLLNFIVISEVIFLLDDKAKFIYFNKENKICEELFLLSLKILDSNSTYKYIFTINEYEEISSKAIYIIIKWLDKCAPTINKNTFEEFLRNNVLVFSEFSKTFDTDNSFNDLYLVANNTNLLNYIFFITNPNSIYLLQNNTWDEGFINLIKTNLKHFSGFNNKLVFESSLSIDNLNNLIKSKSPRYTHLIKQFYLCLCEFNFEKAFDIINQSQYNFDLLAETFFNYLINLELLNNKTNLTNQKNNFNNSLLDKTNNVSISISEFISVSIVDDKKIIYVFILLDKLITNGLNIDLNISDIFISNLIFFTNVDAIITQIKIANLILLNINEKHLKSTTEVTEFRHTKLSIYNSDKLDKYLKSLNLITENYISNKCINVMKDLINFLGCYIKTLTDLLDVQITNNDSLQNCLYDMQKKCKGYFQIIQSRYFPVKTIYLKENTKEYNDFEIIFGCFINTFQTVKSFEFLEMLFPIIREEKTMYYHKVSNVVQSFISYISSSNNNLVIINEISKIIDLFLNENIDYNIKDNIRFSIMKLIGFEFLLICNDYCLTNIFTKYYKQFKSILELNIQNVSLEKKLIILLQKTYIFKVFSIIFSKINDKAKFKFDIHNKIFGEGNKGNELTKILTIEFHNAKNNKIQDYFKIKSKIVDEKLIQDIDLEYLNYLERHYYSNAYNALAYLLKITQISEDVFVKFLFKCDWELIIGENNKWYNDFLVETSFSTSKIDAETGNDTSSKDNSLNSLMIQKNISKNKILIDNIVSDSFFHDVYGKTLKDSFIDYTFKNSAIISSTLNINNSFNVSSKNSSNNKNIENLLLELYSNDNKHQNIHSIELDKINKHPVMKVMYIMINYLYNTFTIKKKNNNLNNIVGNSNLPNYLQPIIEAINKPNCLLSVQIFFAKLILNHSNIFMNYISHILPFLLKLSTDKKLKSKAKGFHYFLRDIATFILSNSFDYLSNNKENIEMISAYINSLCKLAGDTKNLIFRTNLKLISDLIHKFKQFFILDYQMIIGMLKIDDNKPTAHIWKITAVQLIATCLENNVKLSNNTDNNGRLPKSNFTKSSKSYDNILIGSLTDDIFILLVKLSESNKTPVHSALYELLGKILSAINFDICNNFNNKMCNDLILQNSNSSLIVDCLENLISTSKIEKTSINLIFRVCMHYPSFLKKKKIFYKSIYYFKSTTQSNRILLLSCFTWLLNELIKDLDIDNLSSIDLIYEKSFFDDVFYAIFNQLNIIFVDPSEELINVSVLFLETLTKLWDNKYFKGILLVNNAIQKEILKKDESTRLNFYSFQFYLYNLNSNNKQNVNLSIDDYQYLIKSIFNNLIVNLSYEKTHRVVLIEFINETILPKNPVDRLLFILNNIDLKIKSIKSNFIKHITRLMLILVYTSDDFKFKIYEKPLDSFFSNFVDLDINSIGNFYSRSQPIPPSINIRDSMDQAYNKLINNLEIYGENTSLIKSTQDLINATLNCKETIINKELCKNDFKTFDTQNSNLSVDNNNNSYNKLYTNNLNSNIDKVSYTQRVNDKYLYNNDDCAISKNSIISHHSNILFNYSSFVDSNNNMQITKRLFKLGETKKFTDKYQNEENTGNALNINNTNSNNCFKAPAPVIIKRNNYTNSKQKKGLGKFLNENEMTYNPISSVLNDSNINKIRFVADGVHKDEAIAKKNLDERIINKFLYRQIKTQNLKPKFTRKYRVGELPDIEITNKELLDPLIEIASNNSDISCELLIEIILIIYKDSMSLSNATNISDNNSSDLYNNNIKIKSCELTNNESIAYTIKNKFIKLIESPDIINNNSINFILRLLVKLFEESKVKDDIITYSSNNQLKDDVNVEQNNNKVFINTDTLKQAIILSNNYYPGILIIEEIITSLNKSKGILSNNSSNKIQDPNQFNIDLKVSNNLDEYTLVSDINLSKDNRSLWVLLLNIYSKLLMKDYEIGIIQNFSSISNMFVKNENNKILNEFSKLLTNGKENSNRISDINKLLNATFKISCSDDETTNKLSSKDDLENNYYKKFDSSLIIDDDLLETLESYALNSNNDLGQWSYLENYVYKTDNLSKITNKILINKEKTSANYLKYSSFLLDSTNLIDIIHENKYNEYDKNFNTNYLCNNLEYNLHEKNTNTSYRCSLKEIVQNNKYLKYNLALEYIKTHNYDEALMNIKLSKEYFYEEFANVNKDNKFMLHEIISEIQKIFEVNETLSFIRNYKNSKFLSFGSELTKTGISKLLELVNKSWLDRWPSWKYDSPSKFQEIFAAREIFFNSFNSKFSNFKSIVEDNITLESFTSKSCIKLSEAFYKKKLYDLSEKQNKAALNMRKEGKHNEYNSFILLPILKTKYKMIFNDSYDYCFCLTNSFTINDNKIFISNNFDNIQNFNVINKCFKKYKKLTDVLNEHYNKLNSLEEFSSYKIKLSLLKCKIQLSMSIISIEEDIQKYININKVSCLMISELSSIKYENAKLYYRSTFKEIDNFVKDNFVNFYDNGLCSNNILIENNNYANTNTDFYYNNKIIYALIKYCDKILRNYSFIFKNQDNNSIEHNNTELENQSFLTEIQKNYILLSLKSLSLNNSNVSSSLPKILEIIKDNIENKEIIDIFINNLNTVQTKYFIEWKIQLVPYINSNISKYLEPIFYKIISQHPQELYFPFTCYNKYNDVLSSNLYNNETIESKITKDNNDNNSNNNSELFKYLINKFNSYKALSSMVISLDYLTHPDQRLMYWLNSIKEKITQYVTISNNLKLDNSNKKSLNFLNTIMYLKNIIEYINQEIISTSREYIGDMIGSYNLRFSITYRSLLKTSLSIEVIENLLTKKNQDIIKEFPSIFNSILACINGFEPRYSSGIEKLSLFSNYLSQYELLDENDSLNHIYLPINIRNICNLKNKPIKITSFDQHVLILRSIRTPKRLIVNCDDEKSYAFLIKGGEDMRIDHRIMELFSIFNNILYKSECQNYLNTYNIHPLTLKLGMVEWVPNTVPLKTIVNFSMRNIFNKPKFELNESDSHKSRLIFLQKNFINTYSNINDITSLHKRALFCNNDELIIEAQEFQESLLPNFILKKGLENNLSTPEEILNVRINFMRKYAVLCIAGYILGIGDRHLENYLIDIYSSNLYAIDFGISFGQGLSQVLPDLMPFRLTNQILNIISPFKKRGNLRQNMIDSLYAFRSKKEDILDYCDVLVKEPVMEWIKNSKNKNKKNKNIYNLSKESYQQTEDTSNTNWYPKKKLKIIENKLIGINPCSIQMDELNDTNHSKNSSNINLLSRIIYGKDSSIRNLKKNDYMVDIESQVDILLEQASDSNILGRLWIGWTPYC